MPAKARTVITLFRIAAIIYALTAIASLVSAYEAHQRNEKARTYVAQAVTWFSLCIVFMSVAGIKGRAIPADENASPKNPNDGNA
jgi:hypothetical protein